MPFLVRLGVPPASITVYRLPKVTEGIDLVEIEWFLCALSGLELSLCCLPDLRPATARADIAISRNHEKHKFELRRRSTSSTKRIRFHGTFCGRVMKHVLSQQ